MWGCTCSPRWRKGGGGRSLSPHCGCFWAFHKAEASEVELTVCSHTIKKICLFWEKIHLGSLICQFSLTSWEKLLHNCVFMRFKAKFISKQEKKTFRALVCMTPPFWMNGPTYLTFQALQESWWGDNGRDVMTGEDNRVTSVYRVVVIFRVNNKWDKNLCLFLLMLPDWRQTEVLYDAASSASSSLAAYVSCRDDSGTPTTSSALLRVRILRVGADNKVLTKMAVQRVVFYSCCSRAVFHPAVKPVVSCPSVRLSVFPLSPGF